MEEKQLLLKVKSKEQFDNLMSKVFTQKLYDEFCRQELGELQSNLPLMLHIGMIMVYLEKNNIGIYAMAHGYGVHYLDPLKVINLTFEADEDLAKNQWTKLVIHEHAFDSLHPLVTMYKMAVYRAFIHLDKFLKHPA